MIDFRFKDKNNQKKGVRYYFSGKINLKDIGNDDDTKALLFDLPTDSLVKSVKIITLKGGTGPVGLKCGKTALVNDDGQVTTQGTYSKTVDLYFPTGGAVTLNNTAADPTTDAGIIKVGVEYVETTRSIGESTN